MRIVDRNSTIVALVLVMGALCLPGCSKSGGSVRLPPNDANNVPFYVFKGSFSSLEEAEQMVFKGQPGGFRLYMADYTHSEAAEYLEKNGFKAYKGTWIHGWESFTCYQGGDITNRTTLAGDAKVIVEFVPHVGWFRIR